MQRSVNITTPYPTPEETARIYGISKRRAREIRKMVEENLATAVNFYKNGAGFASSGNGALQKKSKSRTSAAQIGSAGPGKYARWLKKTLQQRLIFIRMARASLPAATARYKKNQNQELPLLRSEAPGQGNTQDG